VSIAIEFRVDEVRVTLVTFADQAAADPAGEAGDAVAGVLFDPH
jgi:hypothetical protein